MDAKELVRLVQRQADCIMGRYAKNARLGGTHKYAMGNAKTRRLAAVILIARRKAHRRPTQPKSKPKSRRD
jgi:hypothetical protein